MDSSTALLLGYTSSWPVNQFQWRKLNQRDQEYAQADTYIYTYVQIYIHTRIHTHIYTYIHTYIYSELLVYSRDFHFDLTNWDLQSVFPECVLRISRIITETIILLYEKGDANLETSHREWGPWVNTNHLERARPWALVAGRPTLGYFPKHFYTSYSP